MLSVYTYGSQPAQYVGTTGIPLFYEPWENIVEENGQGYFVIIIGVKYPVIPNPHLLIPMLFLLIFNIYKP